MLQTFVGEKRRRSIHLKIDIKRHTLYRFYQPIIDMNNKDGCLTARWGAWWRAPGAASGRRAAWWPPSPRGTWRCSSPDSGSPLSSLEMSNKRRTQWARGNITKVHTSVMTPLNSLWSQRIRSPSSTSCPWYKCTLMSPSRPSSEGFIGPLTPSWRGHYCSASQTICFGLWEQIKRRRTRRRNIKVLRGQDFCVFMWLN